MKITLHFYSNTKWHYNIFNLIFINDPKLNNHTSLRVSHHWICSVKEWKKIWNNKIVSVYNLISSNVKFVFLMTKNWIEMEKLI